MTELGWDLVAPIAATLIVVTMLATASIPVTILRNVDYRHAKLSNREDVIKHFPVPPLQDGSAANSQIDSIQPALKGFHEKAKREQDLYHRMVLCSSLCLAVGFIAIAIEQLEHELERQLVLEWRDRIATLLGWIDFLTLLAVCAVYLIARRHLRAWIAVRAETEFIRQYQFLLPLFPQIAPVSGSNSADEVRAEVERVKAALNRSDKQLPEHIEALWLQRHVQISSFELGPETITPDAWSTYLNRRILRQLIWFCDARDRLKHSAHRRQLTLQVVYISSATLAAIKLGLLSVTHNPAPLLTFALLLLTAASVAMTAYYMSQNSRSLSHRYDEQTKQIKEWLKSLDDASDISRRKGEVFPLNNKDKDIARKKIIEFEQFMIEELDAWVHITMHDALELG